MMSMSVKSNVKDFVKHLDKVQKKQVPFATARALTWTVKESQKAIQEAIPHTFKVTKKWWLAKQPTGIKVRSAKKTDLEAVVYTTAYFAKLQEEGGIKIPFRGRGILVPTELTPRYGRRSGGAKKLIAGVKVLKFKKRTSAGKGGGKRSTTAGKVGKMRKKKRKKVTRPELTSADPVATMPSGARGVFRRRGKKRLPIERVYSYVPRARIRERMKFKARAYHTALKTFDRLFAKSLADALKTAR
jgi:hypothetical protein